jgi:hypothetical protein
MGLPEFWRFLNPGWWAIHVLGVGIIYMLGMGHGRRQALKMRSKAGAGRSDSTRAEMVGNDRREGQ